MMRARRRLVAAALMVAAALPGEAVLAAGSDDDGPIVIDPLENREVPSAAEIAATITPLEPVVNELEVPEPRSLREEREEGDLAVVSIASDVLFAFDSADLSDRAEATVRDIAADLGEAVGTITVVGHTDSVGADSYNQDLSERRAESVAAVLADELGDVDIETEGRGSQEPVAEESEGDPAAAARNRRVEILHAG